MRSGVMMTMRPVLVAVICLMQGARGVKLTNCESAIYFCCDPFSNSLLPLRCFELNRCSGLYWAGPRICSDYFIDKVTRKRFRKEKPERRPISNEIPDERPKKGFEKKKEMKQANTLSSKYDSVSGPLPFNKPERTPLSSSLVSTKDAISKKSKKLSPSKQASGPILSTIKITSLVALRDRRDNDPTTKCSRAILRCCDAQSNRLPLRCFEQNGCPGIIWQRQYGGACSPQLVIKAKVHLGIPEV